MKNNNNILKKSELKFWISIIGIAVTTAIAFTTLKMEVKAMQGKGVKLRQEVEKDRSLLYEINERTIRIEEKLDYVLSN